MGSKRKKNVFKIPNSITTKLDSISSDDFLVSCAVELAKEDIIKGDYSYLGINIIDGNIVFDPSIEPMQNIGRYSKYNVLGRSFPLKKLPKVLKTIFGEAPNFNGNGTHSTSRTLPVYQKCNWLPKNLSINIELLEQKQASYIMKFSIDMILNKNSDFNDDLLFFCNLLQENIGSCDVFEADATDSEYIKNLYVNWELLPPGAKNIDNNVKAILQTFRNQSAERVGEIHDRLIFFEALNPKCIIRGTNRFSQYFGAKLNDNLVILENTRYGNAIYIFYENWEEMSKLSRTELLNSTKRNFIRIVHSANWKINLNQAINEIS